MATPPFLLQDLSPEQRLRILSLDYVTSAGYVPADEWLNFAHQVETWLSRGVMLKEQANVRSFPRPVET